MQTEQARRIVWRRLDEARTIKARQRAGIAFEWEGRRLESLVREARTYSRLAREPKPPPVMRPAAALPRSESYRAALERAEPPERGRLTPGAILNLYKRKNRDEK